MNAQHDVSPFATVEFVRAWQEWKGLVLEPVGFRSLTSNLKLFLVPRRFGPFNILTFPWVGYGDYLDFPFFENPTDEIVTLLQRLIKNPNWDLLVLPNLLAESPTLTAIQSVAPKFSMRFCILNNAVAPYLTLRGTWRETYERRSPSFRKNLRWSERRLAQIGKLEFIHCCSEQDVDGALDRAFEIYKARWRTRYSRSRFLTPDKEFYRVLAKQMARQGWLDLTFLSVGGHSIAFCYGIVHAGCYYYYITAIDPDSQYSSYSPGGILLKHLIERSFEMGLERFDFMLGNEPYKSRWAEQARLVLTLCAANPTIARSRLAQGAYVGAHRLDRKFRSSPVIRRLADLSRMVRARWS